MSKYTTEVRYICEAAAGKSESEGYSKIGEVISAALTAGVFPDYPIYDESYRNVLNTKILKHYYTREICEETVGRWKLRLDSRMNEIMPYYNKLYESALFKFNPLYDVDLTITKEGSSEQTHEGEFASDAEKVGVEHKGVSGSNDKSTVISQVADISTKGSEKTGAESQDISASAGKSTNSNTSDGKSVTDATSDKEHTQLFSDTPQGSLGNFRPEHSNTYLTNATVQKDGSHEHNDATSSASSHGDTDYSENKTNTGVSSSTSETENKSSSQTDSTTTEGIKNKTDENKNATENSTKKETENKTINSVEDYIERVSGKRGNMSFAKMLTEYRDTLLNIDKMIISDLSDLFFALF